MSSPSFLYNARRTIQVLWATDFSEALLQQLADAYPRIEIEAFSNMIDPEGGSSHRTTAAQ